jgi:hypothetical protein
MDKPRALLHDLDLNGRSFTLDIFYNPSRPLSESAEANIFCLPYDDTSFPNGVILTGSAMEIGFEFTFDNIDDALLWVNEIYNITEV